VQEWHLISLDIRIREEMRKAGMFYMFYPNELSPYKTNLARGVFQDLEFIGALRFRDEYKRKVQDLFQWDVRVLKFLDRRKPKGCETLEDKKHRLLCYLFETTLQMCLNPFDNISENPGCEAFCSVWDVASE